jgi:hypothetical protein
MPISPTYGAAGYPLLCKPFVNPLESLALVRKGRKVHGLAQSSNMNPKSVGSASTSVRSLLTKLGPDSLWHTRLHLTPTTIETSDI